MLSETYNIDCMEYMRSLPDKAFDLAVVDPPYGDGCSQFGQVERERERAAVQPIWESRQHIRALQGRGAGSVNASTDTR